MYCLANPREKARMWSACVTWNVTRFVDNKILLNLYLSGLIPDLPSVAEDENWWRYRLQLLTKLRSFDGWSCKQTYQIVTRELASNQPSIYNPEDNVLAVHVLKQSYRNLLSGSNIYNAIYKAANGETVKILKYLLDISNGPGDRPPDILFYATRYGKVRSLRCLLTDSSIDKNSPHRSSSYHYEVSAIGVACTNEKEIALEMVQMLLESGVVSSSEDLQLAISSRDDVEILKLLLDNSDFMPDLGRAILHSRYKILSLLLSNPRCILSEGDLELACETRCSEVVRQLLDDGRIIPSLACLQAAIENRNKYTDRSRIGVMDLLLRDGRLSIADRDAALVHWRDKNETEMIAYCLSSMSDDLPIEKPILQEYDKIRSMILSNDRELLEVYLDSSSGDTDRIMIYLATLEGRFSMIRSLLGNRMYCEPLIKLLIDIAILRGYESIRSLLGRQLRGW